MPKIAPAHNRDFGKSLSMQQRLREYNHHRQVKGRQPLQIGIGINTGEVTLGVVGSSERMDTTVLGDAVNLASRMESLTKHYGCALLISGATKQALPDKHSLFLRLVDVVQVKGRNTPSEIYEVFNQDEPALRKKKQQYIPLFQQAFTAYQAGLWSDAQRLFEVYQHQFSEDSLANVFIKRCELFLKIPPTSWNGVFRIENK